MAVSGSKLSRIMLRVCFDCRVDSERGKGERKIRKKQDKIEIQVCTDVKDVSSSEFQSRVSLFSYFLFLVFISLSFSLSLSMSV